MSNTLWALRNQVKREEQAKHLPPSRISMRAALGLAETVAREMVVLAEDKARVRYGRVMLAVALSVAASAFAAGFLLGGQLL